MDILEVMDWQEFDEAVSIIISQIKDYQQKFSVRFVNVFGIPRGGLCLAVKLSHLLGIPMITEATEITGNTLIADDCVNTGRTLSNFNSNKLVTLYYKPESRIKPHFYYKETSRQVRFCWEHEDERN